MYGLTTNCWVMTMTLTQETDVPRKKDVLIFPKKREIRFMLNNMKIVNILECY